MVNLKLTGFIFYTKRITHCFRDHLKEEPNLIEINMMSHTVDLFISN